MVGVSALICNFVLYSLGIVGITIEIRSLIFQKNDNSLSFHSLLTFLIEVEIYLPGKFKHSIGML